MYDIHTHLYWQSYDEDREAVLARAREAGIEKMFVIGTTVEESRQAVALAEQYPELCASVGIHPHFFNELIEKEFQNKIENLKQELKNLAQHSKVVAIGECGLDYYAHDPKKTIGHEQRTVQREGFMVQIELAQELKLPLIVHCRASSGLSDDAYQDLLGILQAHIHKLKVVVLHCYMGDTEITKKFLALPGVYFSFAGNITYPVKQGVRGTKDDIQETVKQVPLERMFAETDCPFLAPQDQRGKRNEPAYVRHVAQAVALFKETSSEVVAEAVSENFRFVFGKLT